jgi:hypothetical protein
VLKMWVPTLASPLPLPVQRTATRTRSKLASCAGVAATACRQQAPLWQAGEAVAEQKLALAILVGIKGCASAAACL